MKFVRFILLLLASLSIFLFVTFVNVKMLFSSPDTAKNFLNQSNIYPVATAGIRDNIVKYAKVPIDQNELIEVVNNVITENDLKKFIEDFVDQFFNIVNGKTKDKKITLHFAWLKEKVLSEIGNSKELTNTIQANNFLTDREVDLSSNSFVRVLIHLNDYLIGTGAAVIVLLLLLLLSGSWPQKLIWLGAAFIVSAIGFTGELIIYYFGITERVVEGLAKASNFKDEKFLLGVQKLITTIMDYQKVYYTSIAVGLVVLGIVFIIVGRSFKKHDVKMDKI